MVENIFYTDAKELIVKFTSREFPTMSERFLTFLMNFMYRFCNYEEESVKIRPSLFITNNIDQVVKNVNNAYKIQLFVDDNEVKFNSRMKALMGFCRIDWVVYIELKDGKYNYGICKAFNSIKEKDIKDLVFDNPNLLGLSDKFSLISLDAVSSYSIYLKGIHSNQAVVNFSITDIKYVNREGVVNRFVNASLTKLKTTKKKLAEIRILYANILKKAFNDIHGAICVIVDKDYQDKGYFSDGIWLENPIELSKVFLQTNSYSESKLNNIAEVFIAMLNYDGITIVDNAGRIRAYNVFINNNNKLTNIVGGARKRAAYTVINSKVKRIIGVYFQSQDGEIFYEEVVKWHKNPYGK